MSLGGSLIPELGAYTYTNISLQEKYDRYQQLKENPNFRSEFYRYQNLLLDPFSWHISSRDEIIKWSFYTGSKDPGKRESSRNKAMFVATFVPLRQYDYDKFLGFTIRDGFIDPYKRVIYKLQKNKEDITYNEFVKNVSMILMLLIRKLHYGLLEEALDYGANPNTVIEGSSLLLESTRDIKPYEEGGKEHPEYIPYIKLLLRFGARVDPDSIAVAEMLQNKGPLRILTAT